MGAWYDDRDVRHAAADVREAEIPIVFDVHLTVVPDAVDASEVRYERKSPLREPGRRELESPSDDRPQSIGANDDRGGERMLRPVRIERVAADDTSRGISAERGDADALANDRSTRACALEQQAIEDRSSQREPAITVAAIAVDLSEPALERRAVRCANAHSREMRRPRLFDSLEHAHLVENARGLRAHVLGAGLVTRKMRAIEQHHVDPGAREVERGRGARRSTAYDDDPSAVAIHDGVVRARCASSAVDHGAIRPYAWEAKYSVSRVTRYENSKVPVLGGRYVIRTVCVSGSHRASTVCASASPAV